MGTTNWINDERESRTNATIDRIRRGEITLLSVVVPALEQAAQEAIKAMSGDRMREIRGSFVFVEIRAGKGKVTIGDEITLKGAEATADAIREGALDILAISDPRYGRRICRRPSNESIALLRECKVPYRYFGGAVEMDFDSDGDSFRSTIDDLVLAGPWADAWDRGIEACKSAGIKTTSPDGLELRRSALQEVSR